MNCNKLPEMGQEIYLNGCGCNRLWNEVYTGGAPEGKNDEKAKICCAAGKKGRCSDCMPNEEFGAWPVGMTYVPMQPWEEPFELAKGLHAGTIFPSLRLPFRGGGR